MRKVRKGISAGKTSVRDMVQKGGVFDRHRIDASVITGLTLLMPSEKTIQKLRAFVLSGHTGK